jgi:hypothetical protein
LHWTEPDEDHLVTLLKGALAGDHRERIDQARRSVERYRAEDIARLVDERVAGLLAASARRGASVDATKGGQS